MKKVNTKMTPNYDLQRFKIPAIEEAAGTMLYDNIQPNENHNVDMELTKFKRAVKTVKKEILKPDKRKKKKEDKKKRKFKINKYK